MIHVVVIGMLLLVYDTLYIKVCLWHGLLSSHSWKVPAACLWNVSL